MARTWAGFWMPWKENNQAGKVRGPRSVSKVPGPSLTLVTSRGIEAGGPDIAAPFMVLKAACELTRGNPAADRSPVGNLDGAVMSPSS